MNAALVRVSAGIPRILQSRLKPTGETRINRLGDANRPHSEPGYKRSGVLPPSCKLIYDCLSGYASPLGEVRGLSVPDLASKTALSERAVYRAIKRLEAVRLVSVLRAAKGGRGAVNIYRLRPLFAAWLALKRGTLHALVVVWEYTRRLCFEFSTGKGEPIGRGNPREIEQHPEDPPRIRSPGQVLGHLRRVVGGNDSLNPTQRKAVLTATGRFLFREGGFGRLQRHPRAAKQLIDAYRTRRTGPAATASYRELYGQVRRWLYELTADGSSGADRTARERRGRIVRADRRLSGLERWRSQIGRLSFAQLEWFRERQAEIVRSVEAERLTTAEYRELANRQAWASVWGVL